MAYDESLNNTMTGNDEEKQNKKVGFLRAKINNFLS